MLHRLRLGQPQLLFPHIYLSYVVVSALDLLLTWVVLSLGGEELNRLAAAVIDYSGLNGVIVFKFCMVVLVILLCEHIGRQRWTVGRRVAATAVGLTMLPVIAAAAQLAWHA